MPHTYVNANLHVYTLQVRVEPAEEESFRPRRNPTINRAKSTQKYGRHYGQYIGVRSVAFLDKTEDSSVLDFVCLDSSVWNSWNC